MHRKEGNLMGLLLLILLILALCGSFPIWPHSRSWGYRPSGILVVVLVVIAALFFAGRI
jgi:Protein of unknown function (DUF3309)